MNHLQPPWTQWRNLLSSKVSRMVLRAACFTSDWLESLFKVFPFVDVKNFECSSPSELDRKFFGEHSLLSALSLEQLSTSNSVGTLNNTGADGFDGRPSILASLCLSSDAISPCGGFSPCGSNMQQVGNCNLAVPLQGKSSTPQVILKKPKNATSSDQSYSDLTASQISWDISLIKSESSSPRPFMESSTQEQTWSPKPKQQHLVPEASP